MIKNATFTTTQKDWDDFFAPENDLKTAFDSVDQDWLGLHMVSEHGSEQKYEANKSMDESPFDCQGLPSGFIFDW
jgi:hypothetical protein